MRRRDSHIFLTIASQMAVRLSALCAGRPYAEEDSWYSFLLETESTPGPLRLEGLGQLKRVQ
jgi:hypothetical protein